MFPQIYTIKSQKVYTPLTTHSERELIPVAAAAKLLKEMHESKQIEGRASGIRYDLGVSVRLANVSTGKQWVYHTLQDPNDSATPEDLAGMDAQITAIREENASTASSIKDLRAQLSSLNSTVSTSELRTLVEEMEAEKEAIAARLVKLKSGDVQPIRAEEKEAIDSDMRKWDKIASSRAKIAKAMWGSVLDVLPEGADSASLRVGTLFLGSDS